MKGIGNDIIEIERIALSIKKHKERFLNRLFTKREREYCENYAHPAPHFAGRFAAKEAIAKALSTGIGAALCWLDMEILRESQGNPIVHFSEKALQEFNQPKVLLSISHCHLYASAVALWVE